jgi:hypothetical protein
MDIDDIFKTLEWFSKRFPSFEGKIVWGISGRDQMCATGFRFQGLLIILQIFQGPRGGIREKTLVVDPSRTIQADRLRLARTARHSEAAICVDPTAIRKEVVAGENFRDVATRHIQKTLDYAARDPEGFRTYLFRHEFGIGYSDSRSVVSFQG